MRLGPNLYSVSRVGATERCSLYHQEIASMNSDDATAIRGQEPRQQNWPYSLGGKDVILSCQSQQQ